MNTLDCETLAICTVETECSIVSIGSSVNATIPTPLFGRYSAFAGQRLAVHIVGCEEDLKTIGSLPTFNDAIDWRFIRADQALEADAMIRLVIWNASFAETLPISMGMGLQRWPFLIAYRPPDAPPPFLNGRPTSRLRFEGSITSLLRMLVYSLIIPEAFDGLVCVAYEDLAEAVSRGGEMLHFFRRSEDVQYDIATIFRDAAADLQALGPGAAVCLSLSADSESLTIDLLDEICRILHKMLNDDIFFVVSAVAHAGKEVCISVLTTSGIHPESLAPTNSSPIYEMKTSIVRKGPLTDREVDALSGCAAAIDQCSGHI